MIDSIRKSVLGVLVAAFAVGACSVGFRQPDVRFDGVRLGGIGLRGGTVYAQIHVVNPNGYRLQTAALSYDLDVSGDPDNGERWARLASGTFTDPIRVDARDSALVEIPIEFSYAQMSGAMRSILERGTFDYRVSGVVTVRDPIRRNVPYRRTGTVSMAGVR